MVKKFENNSKITEIESKILSVAGLVTTALLNTEATQETENEITDII